VIAEGDDMRLSCVKTVVLLLACVSTRAFAEPQPDAVVRQLYAVVVAHWPLGIPTGADKTAIWPLLSKRLIREFETAQACEDDCLRQTPSTFKPRFAWLDLGLFSGPEDEAAPAEVVVERTEPQRDGTFRVQVIFTYRDMYHRPPDPADTIHWRGVVTVISEDGRFVVDDILLFEVSSTEVQSRLSQILTRGCDGPRWVGYGKTRGR
jgi:hypothetical protein